MATGFNTEFKVYDRVYHVQTEDRGVANPVIQTLIYVKGEILDSLRSDYSDLLKNPPIDEKKLLQRMESQHNQVVGEIKNGKYDFDQEDLSLAHEAVFNDRPIVDAIIEHLQKDGGIDTLELILKEPMQPRFSSTLKLSVEARLCVSKFPIPNAEISLKFASSLKITLVMLTGKTDVHGNFATSIDLPPSQPGNCAIIVSCTSNYGNDEIRSLITA